MSKKSTASGQDPPTQVSRTKHSSIADRLHELADSPELRDLAKQVESDLKHRVMAHYLYGARSTRGVSQKDIADKMRCSQSRVSKLENSIDAEWSVGDVTAYLDALSLKAQMMILPKDAIIFDEVKCHAFAIRDCLNEMVKMAGDDHAIGIGVSKAHIEAMVNLTSIIVDSLKGLPHFKKAFTSIVDADEISKNDTSCIAARDCATQVV